CFTCGARNEHSPRSCPALRFCYGCHGKGHLSKDCPRIGSSIRQRPGEACERCGSYRHHGSNCSTLWRIYTYLTDTEREAVLADRESKRMLGFDNGGEGYIARDHWCYNCGNSGHLGDDCESKAVLHHKPDESSAFGVFNQLTGPFASLSLDVLRVDRKPRDWETGERFDDGHGFSVEMNVGRKGREKAKTKAREAQRRVEEADDDEPDWFNANRTAGKKNKPKRKKSSAKRSKASSRSSRDHNRSLRDRSHSPRDRVRSPPRHRNRSHRNRDHSPRGRDFSPRDHTHRQGRDARNDSDREWNGRRDVYREGDRDRSQGESRQERGSRWRGGYDRS
ncbi:hypothetical protein BU17DRAFT_52268, partial [Hysterangium stoloniferum]